MKTLPVLSLVPLLGLFVLSLRAEPEQKYLGAAVVLQKVSESSQSKGKTNEPLSDVQLLKNELKDFQKKASGLAPTEAAQRWLSLLDRYYKNVRGAARFERTERISVRDVIAALPPPSAWEELAKLIDARPAVKGKKLGREIGLRLFAHTLVNNVSAQAKDIVALESLVADLDRNDAMIFVSALQQIREVHVQNSDDPNTILQALEKQLTDKSGNFRQQLFIPDLISLVGTEKATDFLRRALTNATTELQIRNAYETEQLARKLALEHVGELKTAQWSLTHSLEATALYEALDKKFGTDSEKKNSIDSLIQNYKDESSQQEARAYYLLGLIAAHREKEAVALVKTLQKSDQFSLPSDAMKSMERAGHTRAIHDFFREMLVQNPDAPLWDEYIELAAKVGETDKMLELARAAASREDLNRKKKNSIHSTLYRALLAADRVEEAVQEMRQIIQSPSADDSQYSVDSIGLELAQVGALLKRPEWLEEGIRAAQKEIAISQKRQNSFSSEFIAIRLAELLSQQNRGAEAETVLLNSLAYEASKKEVRNYWDGNNAARQVLIALMRLYHDAGRSADVLVLLEQSPNWGAKDLVSFFTDSVEGSYYGDGHHVTPDPCAFYVASALIKENRKAEAHKIVDALLDKRGGFDPGYQLLIELDGERALGQLDAVFSRDQFEERPIIWKAVLMQQAGKLEEAERLARKAISIDPSDGEQGPGRRMRAYAVLADIREARGDKQQAEFFRGAVKAIRLSETADRYYEAHLLKQAVKMYEDSLALFSDAYCIQSRLALRLSDMGMHDAAEEHYRRAYELMPESFGRVESHCFGCEHAFDGQRAQGIAEQVFSNLAAKTPEKPQVHYLLGYLREEQGRYKEALSHYQEAVRLDSDYLNAWAHLESVGRAAHMSAADRDAVVLNLIRLDPLNRHGSRSADVTDLRALWRALEKAAQLNRPTPVSLYPLRASKAALEKDELARKANPPRDTGEDFSELSNRLNREDRLTPADWIQQNAWINISSSLFGDEYSQFED